jgi:predicted GNAT family N-acyltransferase
MSTHEDDGETLCVHSVVVREMHRGQKLASWMLRHYNNFLYYNSAVERCVLLCKEELTPLYDRAGYGVNGESDVVHGATPWMEMQITYVREYDDGEGEEGDGEEKGDGGADAAVEALKALKTSEGAA